MEERKLSEVMRFTLGKNPTRMKETQVELYMPEDFESDFNFQDSEESRKDCIINLIKSKAAPISIKNMEKCITSNFLRGEFDERLIDGWFFCYKFNEGRDLEQQIAMFHQGNTLSVKKLNMKTVGELRIKLPNLEKQIVIGDMYKQSLIQKERMLSQAKQINIYTLEMIRKIEED